eukprot:g4574.t1
MSNVKKWIEISKDEKGLKNRNVKGEFARLCDVKTKYESQIDRDIPRTFPTSIMLKDNPKGQTRLKRILIAYANYNPKVGYVQGMNCIVGYLLNKMGKRDETSDRALSSDEKIFWIFVTILHSQKYDLLGLYLPEFPKLHCAAYQLDRLMTRKAPRLSRHFKKYKIEPTMYLCKWLLTMYTHLLPQRAQDLMWDNFMDRGWTYLVRLTFVILVDAESKLLSMNNLYSIVSFLSTEMWTQDGSSAILEDAVRRADMLQITDEEIKEVEFQYLVKASTLQCSDVLQKERESREAMEEIEKKKKKKEKSWDSVLNDTSTALSVGAAVVLGLAAVAVASRRQRR